MFAALCALTGCSSDSIAIAAGDLGTPGVWSLSAEDRPVTGVVVYFHGADQNAHVIQDDDKHADFFDPMLRAGYAVVAADADGNAYGNLTSRTDYRNLISLARAKYGDKPMYYVAESMGALAALALLTEDTEHQVKGFVGITPLMALPPMARRLSYIIGPWGGRGVPDAADPVTWPPQSFAGRDFRLYSSSTDETVPDIAGARAFADRFGEVAHIEVLDCAGGHVAPDCYRGGDVTGWMKSLADVG